MINLTEICKNSKQAFKAYRKFTRKQRYDFIIDIATYLNENKQKILEQLHQETHLSINDLKLEFERTIKQIDLYASDILIDSEISSDILTLSYEPLGPVVVFGASNFPLAYSTAGGDVISALCAGCSVIFKVHSAHPKASKLVSNSIIQAMQKHNMPENLYQHIELDNEQAASLVQNPDIQAVGFTGSVAVGRKLFDLCQQRPIPIPFFGELGSINPVFVLPNYPIKDMVDTYVASFTSRAGQACTNPAILILPEKEYDPSLFLQRLQDIPSHKMLTQDIYQRFKEGYTRLSQIYQQVIDYNPICGKQSIRPVLFSVTSDQWLQDQTLHQEIFGMIGIIVTYNSQDELEQIAESFDGQLTASLYCTPQDKEIAQSLEDILWQKVGRIVYNQCPTGVAVDICMQHGGPYPASTAPQFTAVGTRAIERFMRPTTAQNKPDFLKDYTISHNYYVSETSDIQAERLADFVAQKLSKALLEKGSVKLAVSGGRSPIAFFQALSKKKLDWQNVTIGLVDERLEDQSNQTLVKQHLLINNAHNAQFINFNDILPDSFDCIIIGMGEDGHFASLFPDSPNLNNGLNDTQNKYSYQTASVAPKERISMNLLYITKAQTVCLAISGEKKRLILQEIEQGDTTYPIQNLFEAKKLDIFIA